MRNPIVWKEWHEQRWKLVFSAVMLGSVTAVGLAARITTTREIILVLWMAGGLLLSIFSAMGVLAPEHTDGTVTFLLSKPVRAGRVFAWKWLFGWFNFALPMVLCTAVMVLGSSHAGVAAEVSAFAGLSSALTLATMLYSLTVGLAPRQSSQAGVFWTGLAVIVVMVVHMSSVFGAFRIGFGLSTQTGIVQRLLCYVNPLLWWNISEPGPATSRADLYLYSSIQAIIFAGVTWLGFTKWRRTV